MNNYFRWLIIALLLCCSPFSYAGGIVLGATRVIYPSDQKQISLSIRNSDEKKSFLIQSWAEEDNKKSRNILITPPLMVMKPRRENTLRIIYVGSALPADRESLFWLSVKSVPEKSEALAESNTLQLAVVSRIKLFYRPEALRDDPDSAWQSLRFSRSGAQLTVHNPTPFWMTVINLSVGGQAIDNVMVAPRSQQTLPQRVNSGDIFYQTINDYGAHTPKTRGAMQGTAAVQP